MILLENNENKKFKPSSVELSRIDEDKFTSYTMNRASVLTNVSMSCSKVSKNNYSFTLTVTSYYNAYGIRVYVCFRNSAGAVTKHHIGTQYISASEYNKTDTYSATLSINENCTAYGYVFCSYCEDHMHSGYPNGQEDPELWQNTSSEISLTYENPTPVPTAPTSVTLSGLYERGQSPTCSWSGATNATGHDVQRRYWKPTQNEYSQWEAVHTGISGSSASVSCAEGWKAVQTRVRASGPGGVSGWKESNWLYHHGVRVWVGDKFQFGHVRVWNGSSWVTAEQTYTYVYNGSGYVLSQ